MVELPRLLSSATSLRTLRATDKIYLRGHLDILRSYRARPVRRFSRPGHSLLSLLHDLFQQRDHLGGLDHDFLGQVLDIVAMN